MPARTLRSAAASALLFAIQAAAAAQPVGAPATHDVVRSYMDTTCAACNDFFNFANGGWLATATIPAEYPAWGAGAELYERNLSSLHSILDELRKPSPGASPSDRKVGAFYATCMDSARIESEGVRPLRAELGRINSVATLPLLRDEAARLHRLGVTALFGFSSDQDFKDATKVIGELSQGGLGLPDRDYYLRTDSASAKTRREYLEHIVRLLALGGESTGAATRHAERIMSLETALARASMTLVEQRDPNAIYHRMTRAELQRLTPSFSWSKYLAAVGAPAVTVINVQQPDFFKAMNSLLASIPMDDWKAYLRFHYLDEASRALGSAFVNERFRFRATLTGQKEQQPRWKRCLQFTDAALGEALGQAYVQRAFTVQAKARALELVRNLEAALADRLGTLEWMSDSTRRQAQGKLTAFAVKIGYPDRWRDYSALDVRDDAFVSNYLRATEFETARQLAKIGKPVDRAEWGMTPPTVNAYYNPTMNEIVFPAGILQPPYFDPLADDAMNYGAIGSVIGHEMTHGFDDQGRQFDAAGNLRDWWTTGDATTYTQRATLVSNQYDGYVAVDSLRVNGKLTLGENIADLGGLKIAYAAFQKAMAGKPRQVVGGFTPEQRFFLSFAQAWRAKLRPELLRLVTQTDPHSPNNWRVNGPLSNMPEFFQAFGCKLGDRMVRPEALRAQIW
ncbi:MAG: M13 family metallopeptidase [Gemmatimonadota bacterium]|nr:M13 family metallopeptidase [Gemmatimonadota bacterium]